MPADILGSVYERFLGKTLTITASGARVKVADKPEVKKAGGVYYTPAYIVKHIVKTTLAPLLKGKTVEQAKSIRVLDLACGSGAFLVEVYRYLLDWHFDRCCQAPSRYAKQKLIEKVAENEGKAEYQRQWQPAETS